MNCSISAAGTRWWALPCARHTYIYCLFRRRRRGGGGALLPCLRV